MWLVLTKEMTMTTLMTIKKLIASLDGSIVSVSVSVSVVVVVVVVVDDDVFWMVSR
jgi:hypothetical protein